MRRHSEQCQGELHEVLGHLRNAEDYIGQLLRDQEGLVNEREHLIHELNRIKWAITKDELCFDDLQDYSIDSINCNKVKLTVDLILKFTS